MFLHFSNLTCAKGRETFRALLCVFNCVFLCQVLKTASQEDTEEGVQSVVTIKVDSDITAFCNASNEHGTAAVTFNIKASEFLLLLVSCLCSLCLYACASLFVVLLAPPPSLSLCSSPSCLSLRCLCSLRLKASSSAMCCNVLPVILDISIAVVVVVVSDETLQSCAAVQCAPLLPQCVNRECPPFCASNCFQLHTPPHQPPPPPLQQLAIPFPPPQVRPQSLCTAHQAPLESNQLKKFRRWLYQRKSHEMDLTTSVVSKGYYLPAQY